MRYFRYFSFIGSLEMSSNGREGNIKFVVSGIAATWIVPLVVCAPLFVSFQWNDEEIRICIMSEVIDSRLCL